MSLRRLLSRGTFIGLLLGISFAAFAAPDAPTMADLPGMIDRQTHAHWTVLRQTDLATGASIDRIVDESGTAESPWPIEPTGSRFDLYSMPWGEIHWTLVASRTLFKQGNTQSLVAEINVNTSDPTQTGRTEHGAPVYLSVQVPKAGDYLLTADGEDPMGEPLEHYGSWSFSTPFSVTVKAENLEGRDVYRLYQKENGKWIFLAKNGIEVLPNPVCKWNLGTKPVLSAPLPTLVVNAKNLHPQSISRIELVSGFHHQTLIEYSNKEKFDFWQELSSLNLKPGSYSIQVFYKSPVGEKSQRPETWKETRLLKGEFTVK